jgi:hydroxymethylpyrimidine/phosphomethylpyrimidine kinase
LLQRATLVTPNATEAAALTGLGVTDLDEAAAAGRALGTAGVAAVLVKGGHLAGDGDLMTDTLCVGDRAQRFSRARVGEGDVRGTGCALATAIAVHLGRRVPLVAAIDAATLWLGAALAAAVVVDGERHLPSRSPTGPAS